MDDQRNLSVEDALLQARTSMGMPIAPSSARDWAFEVLGVQIGLPNFSWRKDAIDQHDLHHLILSEPFTMAGECQVATWEFAAGAYPDVRAQIFCMPLVFIGVLSAPRRTWNTFQGGARCQTLYSCDPVEIKTMQDAREYVWCDQVKQKSSVARFVRLVFASLAVISVPMIFVGLVLWWVMGVSGARV